MTGAVTVSVIIPNRDRIAEIGRGLKALDFQTFRDFEVIVVSNQPEAITSRYDQAGRAKVIAFDEPNISAVRNAGIGEAAGDLIAFLDDDAVPEPTWLERLIAPFENPNIGAVGGLVRGRNGVSLQWGAQEVDCFGNDWPLPFGEGWIKAPSRPDRVLKTVGTNSAFRAEPLREIGFDRAYRFYLDETDVNWRLTKMGWDTVIVPNAQVHHGYARSQYRTSERAPKSLFEIGASKAYFCKQFGDPAHVPEELDGFRRDQRNRLIRAMELGLLAPTRVSPLIDTLEEGFVTGAGRTREIRQYAKPETGLVLYPKLGETKKPALVTTRLGSRKDAYRQARNLAASGHLTTLFDFSYTARMLTVRFTDQGYWLHKGGVFGRTERRGRVFFLNSYKTRVAQESIRIAAQRDIGIAGGTINGVCRTEKR